MKLYTQLAFLSCALGLVSAAEFLPLRADTFFASTLIERDFDPASCLNTYDKAMNAFSSDSSNGKDFNYAAGFLIGVTDRGICHEGITNLLLWL
jgi:hypothetical protein